MNHNAKKNNSRGRHIKKPRNMPLLGWRDILLRVRNRLDTDNLGLIAGGVAFFFLLAIFPAISAMVAIYGLVNDPTDMQEQFQSFSQLLPTEASEIILSQLQEVTRQSSASLSLGALLGMLFAFWSSMKGMLAMIRALNVVNLEDEKRGFFELRIFAFFLTVCSVIFVVVCLFLIAFIPLLLNNLGLASFSETLFSLLRWPLLTVMILVMLAIIFRFAPSRNNARWVWIMPGTIVAVVLWLIGSILFSWYTSNYAQYNATYGSLGAVIVLLLWFYLTAYIVLIGGVLNSEMEHQTGVDTTIGEEKPIGQRKAEVADTWGESP
jgi:membrane protein